MVELTDREKKIVLINYTVHSKNGMFAALPDGVKEAMLIAALKFEGLEYDPDAMLDIGQAILDQQQAVIDNCTGFLQQHPEELQQGLKMLGDSKKNGRFSLFG